MDARRDGLPGQVEGGGGRGAGVLHVEDRDSAEAERPKEELPGQHLLARDRPGDGIAEVAGLHLADGLACIFHRRVDSLGGEILQAAVRLLGESRHADSGHVNLPHLAAPDLAHDSLG